MKYRSQFDVFHFNYGSTLIDFRSRGIHHWDLPFYPKAKMVFTYNGCDARQKYRTIERVSASACHEDGCNGGICKNGRADKDREKRIRSSPSMPTIFLRSIRICFISCQHPFLPSYLTALPAGIKSPHLLIRSLGKLRFSIHRRTALGKALITSFRPSNG